MEVQPDGKFSGQGTFFRDLVTSGSPTKGLLVGRGRRPDTTDRHCHGRCRSFLTRPQHPVLKEQRVFLLV